MEAFNSIYGSVGGGLPIGRHREKASKKQAEKVKGPLSDAVLSVVCTV